MDGFSILGSRYLHCINMFLQEIMCNTKPFGSICVMLSGDPGQLPPVTGLCMWESPTTNTSYRNECLAGFELFNSIRDVVHLHRNLPLDSTNVDALEFDRILRKLRDGELNYFDYELIRKTCCRHYIGDIVLRERFF